MDGHGDICGYLPFPACMTRRPGAKRQIRSKIAANEAEPTLAKADETTSMGY
jgi:hypothetical protein